jgi:hypothetical protein
MLGLRIYMYITTPIRLSTTPAADADTAVHATNNHKQSPMQVRTSLDYHNRSSSLGRLLAAEALVGTDKGGQGQGRSRGHVLRARDLIDPIRTSSAQSSITSRAYFGHFQARTRGPNISLARLSVMAIHSVLPAVSHGRACQSGLHQRFITKDYPRMGCGRATNLSLRALPGYWSRHSQRTGRHSCAGDLQDDEIKTVLLGHEMFQTMAVV